MHLPLFTTTRKETNFLLQYQGVEHPIQQMLRAMRTLFIAFAGVLMVHVTQAQQARFDYVNAQLEHVSPDEASFRRQAVLQEDGYYHVHIRFLDGQTRMIGTYMDEALTIEDGKFEYYFFGGKPESVGYYSTGEKVGTWKRWNWKGEALPSRRYTDDLVAVPSVDRSAMFPGGYLALQDYISEQLHYPTTARNNDIQGYVEIAFTIKHDGSIRNVQILESDHEILAKEGFRLVANMPNWDPAIREGDTVDSTFILPITFELGHSGF